jgi:TonB-linked SusC/RagA family outer membrane protein
MNNREMSTKNYRTNLVCKLTPIILMAVFIFFQPLNAFSQNEQVIVTGKIVDEKNEPIIGASVFIEGTSIGTVTDFDGKFSLKTLANSILSITYVGYTSQKVKATTTPVHIVLKEDNATLNEVVVVGYGQQKRANVTGAVTSMDMKGVQDYPAPSLATVLAGQMPGVQVDQPTGNPIGSPTISIRASSSFSGTANPLFVIDGFIRDLDAFNMLDPSEVENISVLKDASAAVYGVRGRDGVIIVKTKRGSEGKPKINYSASYGVNQGINMPKMMSAYQQAVALNDYWSQRATYMSDQTSRDYFEDAELQQLKSVDNNWIDQAWHDSNNTRHTLNVTGGSDKVKYFIGGSYMNANGNFDGLYMNRYGIRFGVDADITSNLKGSFSMDYNQKETHSPLNSNDTEYDRMYRTFSELVRTSRWIPAYIDGLAVNNTSGSNALAMLNSGSYRKGSTGDVTTSMQLEYNVPQIKGLKLKISGNYNKSSNYGKSYAVPYNVYNFYKDDTYTHLYSTNQYDVSSSTYVTQIENGNYIYESASFGYSYQINPQISYSAKFGKHSINAMVIYEQSESGGNSLSETRSTLIIPNYEVMDGYDTTDQTTASTIDTKTRRQGVISRIDYTFDDKYIIEAAGRNDASTNFAKGYRWGFFPTISLGWRISQEPFFEKLTSVIDNMKIRGSFGILGSDNATQNQYRYSYSKGGYVYIGGSSTNLTIMPNNSGLVYTNATWEKTKEFNLGLDMNFLRSFTFSADGYYKHTTDILNTSSSTYAQATGTSTSPSINYGIQDAWGAEFELKYDKKINKDFSIQSKAGFTYLMNKVIKKYQASGAIGTWKDENGKVAGGEVGYTCIGIARTQEDVDNYISDLLSNYETYHGTTGSITVLGLSESEMKPGMLMYKDMGSAAYQDADGNWHDGAPDGIIDDNDQRTISKYSFAPYLYTFSVGFTWKDVKVDVLFSGQFGNDVFYEKGFWTTASGGNRSGAFLSETSNQLSEWYGNYWTENNVNAKYPRLDENSLRGYRSTFWMRDGHTLQLKTINISYPLPLKYIKKIGFDQCRVYCQASNIWTIINPYPYKDASVSYWSDYPMVRTINFGLNLSL